MNYFLLIFLAFFPFSVFSQITIEPNLILKRVWYSVDNNPSETLLRIEKSNGIQYGLGVEISTKLLANIKLSLMLDYSQAGNSGDYDYLDEQGRVITTDFGSSIQRWNNAIYFSFNIFESITVGAGGHVTYQPSIYGNFFGRNSTAYRAIEFGLGTSLKYTIKKINISLDFYRGFLNKGGNFYYFDPLKTLGLRLGYLIELKRN